MDGDPLHGLDDPRGEPGKISQFGCELMRASLDEVNAVYKRKHLGDCR
jgi:hypothetical protein